MTIIQKRSKRKPTGGRYKAKVPKRNAQTGRRPVLTSVGEKKLKTKRTLGGNSKLRLLSVNKVNLMDPKTNKASIADLKTILENPANRHFVRRNILSKGAIIETPKGKAKVTNRPSQEGFVNAVLV
ncbi:30S ribosomal protein S8e [archaeon]|nr:30S ribosomal protein S8e [archaeon]MBL7057061.1 30S ribosomal protein S8e [Candidatus Woesearchaeota archaeon]